MNALGAINIQAIINKYGILEPSDLRPEDYLIVAKKVGQKHQRNGEEFIYTVIPATILGTSKVYRALLSQKAANPPTIIELENNIGSIGISYLGAGVYHVTATGLLTLDKTFIVIGNAQKKLLQPLAVFGVTGLDGDGFDISTEAAGQNPSDGILDHTAIEIRVYP